MAGAKIGERLGPTPDHSTLAVLVPYLSQEQVRANIASACNGLLDTVVKQSAVSTYGTFYEGTGHFVLAGVRLGHRGHEVSPRLRTVYDEEVGFVLSTAPAHDRPGALVEYRFGETAENWNPDEACLRAEVRGRPEQLLDSMVQHVKEVVDDSARFFGHWALSNAG